MSKPRRTPEADRAAAGTSPGVRPRVKVWVVADDVKFGDGRAQLLEAIVELGSLQKAVRKFGMSYRSIWGYFRELERAMGVPLLERHPGGRPGGGTRLTPEGRDFLDRYRRFRQGIDTVVERQFTRSFPPRRGT